VFFGVFFTHPLASAAAAGSGRMENPLNSTMFRMISVALRGE
jgi:hypothetical protein